MIMIYFHRLSEQHHQHQLHQNLQQKQQQQQLQSQQRHYHHLIFHQGYIHEKVKEVYYLSMIIVSIDNSNKI